jgi:Polyketide cyclase / dehydrase and lipid transport
MAWESEVVGTASNTITAVNQNTEVQYQLVFVKPFEGTFKDHMKLEPTEAGTKVTWYNEQPPLPFAMRLMAGMIKADISKAYQDGLTNLKAVDEAQPAAPAAPADTTAPAAH